MHIRTLLTLLLLTLSFEGFSQSNTPKPLPTKYQIEWQQMETYAFVHFGLNTFADREWGYGDTPASVFNPTELDCEQWVRTFVKAGLKGVILTAKHHDGFCLWPTKLTDYNISNTPYKNGKGDIVMELAQACKKYGLKFAVYLSPWDRHAANYGTPEYVDYFYAQLEELLTRYGKVFEIWFDGANGGDGWYGGANEKRQIDNKTYYQWDRAYAMIDKYQPQAIIFSDSGPGCRWVGNEKGFAGETNWAQIRKGEIFPGESKRHDLMSGHEDGNQWTAAECDVSIRRGWFYHPEEDKTVKSPEEILDLYYKSVGRNATLLLNFPVDRRGLIPAIDSQSVVKFHELVMEDFKTNLAKTAKIMSDNRKIRAKKLTDSKLHSFFTTTDKTSEIILSWKSSVKFNRVLLQENIARGQNIAKFDLSVFKNGEWKVIDTDEETTTVGYKRIIRLPQQESDKLRIRILQSKDKSDISEIGIYNAPDREYKRNLYTIETLSYTVQGPNSERICDNDINSIFESENDEIVVDLGKEVEISKVYYVPSETSTVGLVKNYVISIGTNLSDMHKVAEGEFSNIKNNPVVQSVSFDKSVARYVRLKATQFVSEGNKIKVAELYIR